MRKFKKKIMSLILIGILACNFVGCGKQPVDTETTTTTKVTTEEVATKNEDMQDWIDELDKNTTLTAEEKYEKAIKHINMDEYLTPAYDNITPITPVQALEMVENGETFVVFNGRSDCRYCKYVYPISSEELPEGMKLYYVSTDYFRFLYPTTIAGADGKPLPDDKQSEFFQYVAEKHNHYKEVMDFEGVPNIRYFKNGQRILNVSNPLSPDFFDDSTSSETKEQLLSNARETIKSYLEWIYEDMQNTDTTNTPSVTVVK